MYVAEKIVAGMEIARISRKPVLYMSNPGYGKTTDIERWANQYGYDLVTLIGSANDRAEVLGYYVNTGKPYLESLSPEWFYKIQERSKAGHPTVLFIDELSTAPSDVQATFFRLINERTINNGEKLPKDCIIVSAANYKENLSGFNGIEAPALNRFIVLNVNPTSFDETIDEYMNEEIPALPQFPEVEFNGRSELYAGLRSLMHRVSSIYTSSDSESSKGMIDITNKDYSNMYDNDFIPNRLVYNFISGRSLSLLPVAIEAVIRLNLQETEMLENVIAGLVGAGTNSFEDPLQVAKFNNFLAKNIRKLCNDITKGTANFVKKEAIKKGEAPATVVEAVTSIQNKQDSLEEVTTEDYANLAAMIIQKFPLDLGKAEIFNNSNKARNLKFFADLRALDEASEMLKMQEGGSSIVKYIKDVKELYNGYTEMAA